MSRTPIAWGDRPPEAREPPARSRADVERARGRSASGIGWGNGSGFDAGPDRDGSLALARRGAGSRGHGRGGDAPWGVGVLRGAMRWPQQANAEAPVTVYVTEDALRAIHAHGRSSHEEQGGVLLGRVWREAEPEQTAQGAAQSARARGAKRAALRRKQRIGSKGAVPAFDGLPTARYLVEVDATLAAEDVVTSGVSFRFGRHTWERLLAAWRTRASDLELVGWYHTHPNLGAFFSGTDRATQRDLFVSPWMLGLVVDPYRDEEAWFAGPASAPVHGVLIDRRQDRQTLVPGPTAAPTGAPRAVRVKRVSRDGTLLLDDHTRVRVAGVRLASPYERGKRARRLLARARALLARSLRRTNGRAEIVDLASAADAAGVYAAHVLVRGRDLGALLRRHGLERPEAATIGADATGAP